MWNPITIDTDQSLYRAVADALERDILNGTLKPGEKLPTHRELADLIGINLTTATRAYREAERRGLIAGTVGRGTYVSTDRASDVSASQLGEKGSGSIDLGPVFPLYTHEPDLFKLLEAVNQSGGLNRFLRYSDPLGQPEHREAGAFWIRRFGVDAAADDVLVCAGGHHALTCCLTSLFEPGDRIAVDCLTYSGFRTLAKSLGIKLEPIAMDAEGMIPEDLEAACHRSAVKGIYLMPTVQNPTNASMSAQRREQIAAIAERCDLTVLEDDIYGFTRPQTPKPIASIIPHRTVYVSSVSKALLAGLRVAFVVSPRRLRYPIAKAILNTIWMAPPLNAAIVSECIRSGLAETIVQEKRREAVRRCEVAQRALSGCPFVSSPAGYYVWLRLEGGWTGAAFENRAQKAGVNVFCAEKFIVGSTPPPPAVRLSLTGTETLEQLERGLSLVALLAKDDAMDLQPIL